MSRLDSKIVLVTGAKGGLGSAVTQAMLDAGATVIGVSRSIRQTDFAHPSFHARSAELSTRESAAAAVDAIDDAFAKMFALNFYSALHLFQAALPAMRRQGFGRILAIGSKASLEPAARTAPYNVSKAALLSLVRTIAEENKTSGITANIVLPGTMDTPANRAAMPDADFSHWVQPSQVAALLVHLVSDEASQITGAAIPIYGRE
jgi:NAD(P)-dependent dehydrogenase (short-subunit alcohol dehydrogenase family)